MFDYFSPTLFPFLDTPWARVLPCSEGEAELFAVRHSRDPNQLLRILRGKRCSNKNTFFAEWAAALQFPYYFASTWESFEECLCDLEWLGPSPRLLLVTCVDQILLRSNRDFKRFLQSLSAAASGKAPPDRPAQPPLTVVFHCDTHLCSPVRSRLSLSGVDCTPITPF